MGISIAAENYRQNRGALPVAILFSTRPISGSRPRVDRNSNRAGSPRLVTNERPHQLRRAAGNFIGKFKYGPDHDFGHRPIGTLSPRLDTKRTVYKLLSRKGIFKAIIHPRQAVIRPHRVRRPRNFFRAIVVVRAIPADAEHLSDAGEKNDRIERSSPTLLIARRQIAARVHDHHATTSISVAGFHEVRTEDHRHAKDVASIEPSDVLERME